MERLYIDGLDREEARNKIIGLERNKEFLIQTLSDGRKVFIKTDGKKKSKVNGKEVSDIDITIHYDGEIAGLNYIDDVIIDLLHKQHMIGEEGILTLLKAIKDSIELISLENIYEKYPELKKFEKMNLLGHSIEFLLVVIKCLALQEDINYWGTKPNKKEKYEGREKPYNALKDVFIKKMRIKTVIKKHMLYY